jgi:urease accessory protein
LLLSTQSAHAHADSHQTAGFVSGFGHPWSGWDHIIAMIAVGLWGAQLGAPAVWLLPVTFPMVMAVGGFLGLIGVPLPGIEIGIGMSALLLGTMVAFEAKPRLWIAAIMVGVFGLFHGHAHGTELPDGQNGMLYSIGFVVATGCLHGVGISLGLFKYFLLRSRTKCFILHFAEHFGIAVVPRRRLILIKPDKMLDHLQDFVI